MEKLTINAKKVCKYIPIRVEIGGKIRILKNITYLTGSDLEGEYKGYSIVINEQETGGFYARVTHPDGCYIVDGYFTEYKHQKLCDVVKECIHNILL